MGNIIEKKKATELINSSTLLPISKIKDGFLLTDFCKTYHLITKGSYDGKEFHPESIWKYNQSWILKEENDQIVLPSWFKIETYKKVAGIKNVIIGTDGLSYVPGHNLNTGSHWYASNIEEAIRSCIFYLNPIWDLSISPMTLIYDNGKMGFTEKSMQIWKHNETYHLSFFHSRKEKTINSENISEAAITLIKYSTDDVNSKWRKNKMWKHFLKFNEGISDFNIVSIAEEFGISHHVTEKISIANAGEYIIAKKIWGGLFGGEGDNDENYYIFESKEELIEWVVDLYKDQKD